MCIMEDIVTNYDIQITERGLGNMIKDIWDAILEDMEDQNGERPYELERRVNHSDDEDLYDLLEEFGY